MKTKPSIRRADAAPSPTRPRRGSSGASLVEVLIVLTIILIGVFIAIQIFPIGFTSLKRDEARLRADRLARNVTETLLSDQGALPEAISFSYYDAAGNLQTITDVDPDNLETYGNSDAEIAQNKLYFSDVNKFRYVQNEPVAVPLATATGDSGLGVGVGSVHFLTFGPVFMNATVGNPAQSGAGQETLFNSYLKVTSERLIGTVVNATNNRSNTPNDLFPPTDFVRFLRGANTYVIDYGDDDSQPVILFPQANKVRQYSITYSVEINDTDPVTVETTNIVVTVPANTLAWQTLGTRSIQGGSEIVTRNFTRLTGDDPATGAIEGEGWDPTDPYQYKLVSANVSDNANLGVIAFNPIGANFSVTVPGGVKPFTALVSYAVLDWHILRDDREVPANGLVRTTLPNIRPRGDDTVDLTATGANRTQYYPGLYPKQAVYTDPATIPPASESPDIQVFNLSDASGTARLLTAGEMANRATTDANADYWIDRGRTGGTYPTGGIYINTNRVRAGSKVRILYKAQGNWAVAFQKAAKTYRQQEAAGGQVPVANNANAFAISRNGTPNDFSDDRVVFHRSEINKGVTAAVEITTGSGTAQRVTRLPVRQFSIQNAANEYAFANLSDIATELKNGNYNGAAITDTRIVGNINGASLKTRVVWQDDPNGRNKFRVSDLETFVSRQAQ